MKIKNFKFQITCPESCSPRCEAGRRKNYRTGFTLLETLIAILIFIIAILGPLSLSIYSTRLANHGRNQIIAYYLAEESIEFIRKVRDAHELQGQANWLKGDVYELNKCYGANNCYLDTVQGVIANCASHPSGDCPVLKYDTATGLYQVFEGLVTNEETTFIRRLRVNKITDHTGDTEEDEARVDVDIEWDEKGVTRTLSLEGYIFDY